MGDMAQGQWKTGRIYLLLGILTLLSPPMGGCAPSSSSVTATPALSPPTAIVTPALSPTPAQPSPPATAVAPDPGTPMATPVYRYRVLKTYPHDPEAFTQGLLFQDGELYEGTGLWGRSSLRRVTLETGEVQQQHNLEDRYFGEGLALWGDRLIQLTWRSGQGFVYDRATFQLLQTFQYPTEGWGLTQDGESLILSDGSDRLYFLDPETFQFRRYLTVQDGDRPINRLNELEYINGEVWANIWLDTRIARIDPATGQVLAWIDLAGLDPTAQQNPDAVLNGIAYDAQGDRLFVTGKLWPRLYEIEILPPALSQSPPPSPPP